LRLSITDACNFKCVYCLPNGYKKPAGEAEPLRLNEIENLVSAFAEMGTIKVRLTGGEPTLRHDFLEIIRNIRALQGIEQIAVSTNGFRLRHMAKDLLAAGVSGINVSIDSLDPKIFAQTTGTDQLSNVLDGIDAALNAGFERVKVNAVLMRQLNEDSFESFLIWIKNKPITVRFIELMPTGQNKDLFAKHHVRAAGVVEKLKARGWTEKERGSADGPALELMHPDFVGRMGVIAPYAKDFCATCNRLRVTSQGGLRLCLFGEGNHNLRDLLQDPLQKGLLQERVLSLLHKKEISHYLPEGRYGNNNTFSAIGG
jgi:cyclic pyranopterin phosphate synthase